MLDPTCGSGAFLFAALNILEPLYEACLERMEAFVDDFDREGHAAAQFPDFREVLAHVDAHPNRRYFILKSIIINNLYGVDIMEEAVEICKLRLFLKLVAQVEDADADLSRCPTSTSTSAPATRSSASRRWMQCARQGCTANGQMLMLSRADDVASDQGATPRSSARLPAVPQMQTEHGMDGHRHSATRQAGATPASPDLGDELDRYLAARIWHRRCHTTNLCKFEPWRESHQPFHWFVEFYGIMHEHGGFDVIIGNPPYVEYKNVRDLYVVKGYRTEACGDLYAFVMERARALLGPRATMGMIVPVSIVSTDGFTDLRALL